MSHYRCSEHDTHQNGCSTCEVAKDYYDKDARIEELEFQLRRILSIQESEGFKSDNEALAEIFLICGESTD